jgi:hypothetical protein
VTTKTAGAKKRFLIFSIENKFIRSKTIKRRNLKLYPHNSPLKLSKVVIGGKWDCLHKRAYSSDGKD